MENSSKEGFMSKQEERRPSIRFKGYTEPWEQRKLEEIANRVKGNDGRMDLPTLTISAGQGWLDQKERFSGNIAGKEQKNYTLLTRGELSYNHGNSKLAKYGAVFQLNDFEEALVPKVYHSFKMVDGNSGIFIEYLFSTKLPDKELRKLISSGARMDGLLNITYDDFVTINLTIPRNKEEQRTIGSFFQELDQFITLQQRELELMKEGKKTLLSKMFPKDGENFPEIRFPGFTDAWEQRKLWEVLSERNIQEVPTAQIPLVSFTVEHGVTPKTERYNREFLVREETKKYKYTKYNDIVYNPANLKFGAIARNKYGEAFFSPIYVTFEANYSNVLPEFIEKILTSNDFIKKALKFQEGTVYERMAVKADDFLKLVIKLPTLPEQIAIGSFFQELDQLITLQQRELEILKTMKSTLLKAMFA